jgi:AcrB/AcrD/AcrF family protein
MSAQCEPVPLAHLATVSFGDHPNLRAWPLSLVREPEQRPHLADRESEQARSTDEIQTLEVLGPVESVAPCTARGSGPEPHAFVALSYNMSVAVWIGFIALFGTAVQTAVVMVIYLEEAVAQKREELGGRLTRQALLEAVKEGALLRLRPKVMTVSTIVASLLPIMWSHSTGAEVMKPLATPC